MTVKKLFIVVFCFSSLLAFSQKVGLVLSGGGASGFAHIGVIQALEENGIPIDYITGTSAGALVGSLYAAGYSPEEIKQFVLSKAFLEMSKGIEQPEQKFLLREPESNAEMLSFSFDQQHITRHFLPTNFISSDRLDFELLRLLGPVSASYGEDFNKLFVPFRCVASDITRKESVILDRGKLNIAVRASMTFPFYLKPTSINDVLLFDGGLYNNFPADVMYHDFDPDYIIGSNVSYNADAPNDNDLIGQITNMLVTHSLFQLPCEQGFLIEPNPSVSTFEFEEIETAIKKGYESTIASIDSIRKYVTVYRSIDSLQLAREAFKAKIKEVRITGVETKVDNPRLTYTKRALYRKSKNENLSLSEIEKRYYRLYSAPQIDFMMPSLQMKSDSTYKLHLDVKKGKELSVGLGGHISSRPVNTGYFSLSYQSAGRVLTKTLLESYFGKFYGSARAQFKLDLPLVYPFSTSAYFVMNRWDYFKSFATFFEDVKPSFLVQNEMYSGIKINFPISRNMVGEADSRIFSLNDTYYQTTDFTNKDTADRTTFAGYALRVSMTQNSLNRRQFANSGHYFRFQARYVNGREHSTSGSTATNSYDLIKFHDWLNLSLDYQSFLVDNRVYHLGLQGQMVFNSQSMFANYTASLLSMTEFVLHPDALSYFLPEYRSPQFIGIGINNIFTIRNKVDIRLDAYLYQPFLQIEEADDGSLSLSKPFKGDTYMASASIIYNSFIGPVRVTGNYFPKQNKPFAFQFSIGYILFNERAIR